VNVWRAQNNYYQVLQKYYPDRVVIASQGGPADREWIEHFIALGKNLAVHVDVPAVPRMVKAS